LFCQSEMAYWGIPFSKRRWFFAGRSASDLSLFLGGEALRMPASGGGEVQGPDCFFFLFRGDFLGSWYANYATFYHSNHYISLLWLLPYIICFNWCLWIFKLAYLSLYTTLSYTPCVSSLLCRIQGIHVPIYIAIRSC
jgi:hypothetical protein